MLASQNIWFNFGNFKGYSDIFFEGKMYSIIHIKFLQFLSLVQYVHNFCATSIFLLET